MAFAGRRRSGRIERISCVSHANSSSKRMAVRMRQRKQRLGTPRETPGSNAADFACCDFRTISSSACCDRHRAHTRGTSRGVSPPLRDSGKGALRATPGSKPGGRLFPASAEKGERANLREDCDPFPSSAQLGWGRFRGEGEPRLRRPDYAADGEACYGKPWPFRIGTWTSSCGRLCSRQWARRSRTR